MALGRPGHRSVVYSTALPLTRVLCALMRQLLAQVELSEKYPVLRIWRMANAGRSRRRVVFRCL